MVNFSKYVFDPFISWHDPTNHSFCRQTNSNLFALPVVEWHMAPVIFWVQDSNCWLGIFLTSSIFQGSNLIFQWWCWQNKSLLDPQAKQLPLWGMSKLTCKFIKIEMLENHAHCILNYSDLVTPLHYKAFPPLFKSIWNFIAGLSFTAREKLTWFNGHIRKELN